MHPHSRLGYRAIAHPESTSCPNPPRVRFNRINPRGTLGDLICLMGCPLALVAVGLLFISEAVIEGLDVWRSAASGGFVPAKRRQGNRARLPQSAIVAAVRYSSIYRSSLRSMKLSLVGIDEAARQMHLGSRQPPVSCNLRSESRFA